MRKRLWMLSALALVFTGCANSSVDTVTTATVQETSETDTEEETKSSEETKEDKTQDDTEAETTEEPETSGVHLPEDDRYTTDKYLDLMSLDVSGAREYFGVQENAELTGDEFDTFLKDVFVDTICTDRFTIYQFLSDPEAFGVDIDVLGYDIGSLIQSDDDKQMVVEATLDELTGLLEFPYEKLDNRQKLVFDKLYYEEMLVLWGTEIKDYSSVVANTGGIIPNLAVTFYEFSFDNEDSVYTYNRVMEYLPDCILEIYTAVQKQADELGYYPTDTMLNSNIDAINELIDLDNNPFIQGFDAKIDALGLDKDKAEKYKEDNAKLYKEEVVPALTTLRKKLKGFLGKNKDNTLPIELEGGKEFYEYRFESQLGAQITVEEGFELLTQKAKSAYKSLNLSSQSCYDEYLDYYNDVLPTEYDGLNPKEVVDKLIEELGEDYPELGDVEFTVSALPKSLEIDGVLAYYMLPRIDAASTNIMRYNSSALGKNVVNVVTTLAHEGYPGHMLQFNQENDSDCYPIEQLLIRLGYSEGWAMYVVKDTYSTMGLSKALAKTLRCDYDVNYYIMGLADIAFNGMGMSQEEFADYLSDNGFMLELDMESLYDGVTGDPASYVPYSLGKILATKTIDDYIEASGVSALEARASYCEIGPTSFEIVKKYLGTEF